MLQFVLLIALALSADAQPRKWDDLVTTWGRFNSLPRTVADATDQGFVLNTTSCSESTGKPFRGHRYVEDGNTGVMLLFDANGYIAGIQIGIEKDLPDINYPSSSIRPPWVEEGDQYILTVYFVNPTVICTGRSESQFALQGTGTGVYIQNGTHPILNCVQVPQQESVANSSIWTEGACFPSMGVHYFHNIREDMGCDELQPVFLLYNNGTLTAMGLLLNADVRMPRLEHFPKGSGTGLKNPPSCIADIEQLTSLHIYFTSDPAKYNKC